MKAGEPEKPTERQLAYAQRLGITVPPETNLREVSDLISVKVDEDRPAPATLLDFASRHGVPVTKYTGVSSLFTRLVDAAANRSRNEPLVTWFAFCVYCHLRGEDPRDPKTDPNADMFAEAAKKLMQNEAAVKSIRRYSASGLMRFREHTASDGFTSWGGSTNTIAYRQTVVALGERVGATKVSGRQEPTTATRSSNVNQGESAAPRRRLVPWVLLIAVLAIAAWWLHQLPT
jgi:hypothetical protein